MKRIAILVACGAVLAASAQERACTPGEMQRAQKAIDMVSTWQQLNKAWKDWRHCDQGDVGETYTDALLRLMVDWKNVDALAESMKDPEYSGFVDKHLRSPAAKDDLPAIRSRANHSCPKAHAGLCKQIAAAAEGAKPIDLSPMAPLVPAAAPK